MIPEPDGPGTDATVVQTASATHGTTASPTPAATIVVAPGDTLWSIAARHLPAGATDAQIAAVWPRWYEANSPVIGADPDVIRPGQVLTVPAAAAEPAL